MTIFRPEGRSCNRPHRRCGVSALRRTDIHLTAVLPDRKRPPCYGNGIRAARAGEVYRDFELADALYTTLHMALLKLEPRRVEKVLQSTAAAFAEHTAGRTGAHGGGGEDFVKLAHGVIF